MANTIINNEIREILEHCKNANFNEKIPTPEKGKHFSSTDYKDGEQVSTNIKYYTYKHSIEKEKEFKKLLIRLLNKLHSDMITNAMHQKEQEYGITNPLHNDTIEKINKDVRENYVNIITKIKKNSNIMINVVLMLEQYIKSLD